MSRKRKEATSQKAPFCLKFSLQLWQSLRCFSVKLWSCLHLHVLLHEVMITAVFCSQLRILERRNFVSSKRYFVSWKWNFVLMTRNSVSGLEISFRFITLRNFADIRTIEAPNVRRIFVWNKRSHFDCRNWRNFADFGKFRLHFFCTVLSEISKSH